MRKIIIRGKRENADNVRDSEKRKRQNKAKMI